MKTLLFAGAFALALTLTAVSAEEAKKDQPKAETNAPAMDAAKVEKAEPKPAPVSHDFPDPSNLTEKAPKSFKAQFDTTKGKFTIEVTRSLSPNGADRFYNLVRSGYFKEVAFFRVVSGFMCQFGMHGDPAVTEKWYNANIQDDPVVGSNKRGTITYAMGGPNTRSTQFFINFRDNSRLDGMGFSPFGKVVEGMDVVDKINGEYGDMPQQGGRGPNPELIARKGNAYLKEKFPNLDYIKSVTLVTADSVK